MSNIIQELEAQRLAIRRNMSDLRELLEPLAKKTDALREQLIHEEINLTLVCDQLREVKRFA